MTNFITNKMKELINIQSELKAPKSQYNSFGKYQYRNAEDILEAVKPLLKKNNCHLTITDEIILIGDRYYVKATAEITNGTEVVVTSALAREEESKKGMDSAQRRQGRTRISQASTRTSKRGQTSTECSIYYRRSKSRDSTSTNER